MIVMKYETSVRAEFFARHPAEQIVGSIVGIINQTELKKEHTRGIFRKQKKEH